MKAIILTQGYMTLVDDEDYEWLSQWKWHIHKNKEQTGVYAKATMVVGENKEEVYMHRFIMGILDPALWVDHKDWNGLNNQRVNLRVCTQSQNAANTPAKKDAVCKYKGVSYDKKYKVKPWRARIKNILIGNFNTPEGAARAYNKKAFELYGEFAYINIIDKEEK